MQLRKRCYSIRTCAEAFLATSTSVKSLPEGCQAMKNACKQLWMIIEVQSIQFVMDIVLSIGSGLFQTRG